MGDGGEQLREAHRRFTSAAADPKESRQPRKKPAREGGSRRHVVTAHSEDLGKSQASLLEKEFVQFYVLRKIGGVNLGARVELKVGERWQFGVLDSISDGIGVIKLENGYDAKEPMENLRLARIRLTQKMKRDWAREFSVAGGAAAVGHAFRLWSTELERKLHIVRYKADVFKRLLDCDDITYPALLEICRTISGCPADDAAPVLWNQLKQEAPRKRTSSAHFSRNRGRAESYKFTLKGREKYR